MPVDLFTVVQKLRPLLFDCNMLPKPWTLQYMQHSKTNSVARQGDPTGRIDIRFHDRGCDDSSNVAVQLVSDVCDVVTRCLQDLGLRSETIAELTITDSYVHVAFSRCERTQFITTCHAMSAPFEEILVVLPFTHGKPVAIWDQAQICHRDGTPECVIPDLLPLIIWY